MGFILFPYYENISFSCLSQCFLGQTLKQKYLIIKLSAYFLSLFFDPILFTMLDEKTTDHLAER